VDIAEVLSWVRHVCPGAEESSAPGAPVHE
jgi:hypothetical protein